MLTHRVLTYRVLTHRVLTHTLHFVFTLFGFSCRDIFWKHGFVHLGFKTRKRSRIRDTRWGFTIGPISIPQPHLGCRGDFHSWTSCTGKTMKQTALYRNQVVRTYLIIGINKKSPSLASAMRMVGWLQLPWPFGLKCDHWTYVPPSGFIQTCMPLWFSYRCVCLLRTMIATRYSQHEQPRTPRTEIISNSESASFPTSRKAQFETTMSTLSASMGATLLEVNFKPIWFTLTRPQPIERDCVISEDKIQRVKILAGRHKSAEVREEFEDGPLKPENMVCSNSADAQIGKFVPNELNFVFDGLMKFTFENSSFSRTVRLRLAQGSFEYVSTHGNNWWIASKDCHVSVVAKTLICNDIDGKGQMGIKSDGSYVTRKNHKFRVFPWPT